MPIAENIAAIREQINRAAMDAGRDPKEILLCAATKMNGADAVRQAIAAGVDCCGENRVQELTQKLSENAYAGAPVHFIGHLLTNKVRQVVGKVDLIQSVDRIKLLECINAEAEKLGIIQDILLEINIGSEESKSGFATEDILPLLENIGTFPWIRVRGLMAIPPFCENKGDNNKFFAEICNLAVDIRQKNTIIITPAC